MEILLSREPSADGATIGHLFIDGRFAMFTLEDVTRTHKLAGETAIPEGRYPVTITRSQRFGTMLPLVSHVPDFSGIRFHAGNTAADTSGCILVGLARHLGSPTIESSRSALEILMAKMALALAHGEEIWLTIEPAPTEPRRLA